MKASSTRRANVALVASALLVGMLGLGSSLGTWAGASTNATSSTISISNFEFHKMELKVRPGALIKVTNDDSVAHTLTSIHNRFNTGNIAGGRTKTFRAPLKAGTYRYYCGIHQFMTGSIVVR